ncbi:hypothetical protein KQX54_015172 [Cotesia glomerata]|uniref:Uncharacterized protein n=1 Tax=Cotesia glomerata TaxID=32391 RepID=A0AAV7I142_COTGL|nr:hypothetical protein KQX54_015172 [Cotesia glomerata]
MTSKNSANKEYFGGESTVICERISGQIAVKKIVTGCMPIAEFNPIDAGHKIAEIQVDDKVLLLIYTSNDDLSRDFNFPAVDILDDDNHYILYDVNEFHGRCEDKNGVGVITNCTDSCKPIFSWYKDDKIVSQGLLKY